MRIKTFNRADTALDEHYDLLAAGFDENETISYSKELRGETNALKELAKMTENIDKALIYAVDTDNYGIIKHSAAVFENGKLLGISDMTVSYSYDSYMPGANGKLYDLKCGKIGVGLGDDITSFELMRAFAICGAEAVIILQKSNTKEMSGILIKAYAYLLGIPFMLIGKNSVIAADPQGKPVYGDENGIYELMPANEYALKTVKVRSTR